MKQGFLILTMMLLLTQHVKAQENSPIEGSITYQTKNEVYVRFNSTEGMKVGDTLTVWHEQQWKKALIIESLSSQSCKTKVFLPITLAIGTKTNSIPKTIVVPKKKDDYALVPYLSASPKEEKKPKENPNKQQVDSRISLSTNGSRDQKARDFDRLRATASLDILHIQDSRLNLETYLTFNHKLGTPMNDSTFRNDFKVYSLAFTYAHENGLSISVGRKLNNRLANMGAIDGLQIEKTFRKMTWGTFAGTRPDVLDYSFNKNLTQFGGFIAHESETTNGPIQTSLAFVEQKYGSETDRRFVYFQH